MLGKYHQTVCEKCQFPFNPENGKCENCGHSKYVKGVADRISELSTITEKMPDRPPYIHQIPLDFIPGLGPKLRGKLLDHFGTEMAILHEVSFDHLKEVVPVKMAELIVEARSGKLKLAAGGGGKYGKVLSVLLRVKKEHYSTLVMFLFLLAVCKKYNNRILSFFSRILRHRF